MIAPRKTEKVVDCTPTRFRRLLAIETAAKALLGGQIQQWSEVRLTVSAAQLLALRDAVRPRNDAGHDDAYALRKMIEDREAKHEEQMQRERQRVRRTLDRKC